MSYILKSLQKSQEQRGRIGVPSFDWDMTSSPSALQAGSLQPSPATGALVSGLATPARRVTVLGNEKGGAGKSTTAMHVIVALLKGGHTVGCIDLDGRQGTLSRYVENRQAFPAESGLALAMPELRRLYSSEQDTRSAAEDEERQGLNQAMAELDHCERVVIDSPGSDNHLSRLGHALADILITPLNDSFLDLDLLARIDADGRRMLAPSVYSQMVWEQRQQRARDGRPPIDWVVMRNRLSHVDARSKRDVGRLLQQLAKRIGFRLAPGFGERVIFRELFPAGLTLLDLREPGAGVPLNMSHLAARQEVRELIRVVGLEEEEAAVNTETAPEQPCLPS